MDDNNLERASDLGELGDEDATWATTAASEVGFGDSMTQYAIDAAKLVEKCRLLLGAILSMLEERSPSEKSFRRKALQLLVLADGQMNSLDTILVASVFELSFLSFAHISPKMRG